MMDPAFFFDTSGAFPPSFQGDRFAYAFSVFGLFGSALLALEWAVRIFRAARLDRHPIRAPLTIVRLILFLLLSATLLRIGGDVLLIMFWPEVSPETRAALAQLDRIMDGVSVFPMTAAWIVGLFGAAVVEFQLVKQPIPADLWPSFRRIKRPLALGGMILTIALALAFLR